MLLSGGMDSATLACELVAQGYDVCGLGFDYGQRHNKELIAARQLAEHMDMPFDVAELAGLAPLLSASVLTGGGEVPHGHYAEDSMKATVVPNRNMVLLSVAAGFAASRGIGAVATAVHAGDHFVYPDCRPSFIQAMRMALNRAMDGLWEVELLSPFLFLTKTDIARRGGVLGVPYGLTWSCYEGGHVHCGKCGTCVERREAFRDAGMVDPTDYAR